MVGKLLRFVAIAGALVAALGVGVYGVAVTPQKALVYCPVAIDSIGCDHVVAALSGPNGLFPNGVDRGYDGTAGTVDLATADLSLYAVFLIPSLADDSTSRPYDLLRDSRIAYRLSLALQGRLVVWSGTPDQGTNNRDLKDKLIQNLAVWARGAAAAAGAGAGGGEVVLVPPRGRRASVKRNNPDYRPGEPAPSPGGGGEPGGVAPLLLQEHPPLHAARTLTATADPLGNISN